MSELEKFKKMKKFFSEFMWYKKLDYNCIYKWFYLRINYNKKYDIVSLYDNFRMLYQWWFDSVIEWKHFIDINYQFLLDLER